MVNARMRISVPKTKRKKDDEKNAEQYREKGTRLYSPTKPTAKREFVNRDQSDFIKGTSTYKKGPGGTVIVDGKLRRPKSPRYRKPE